MAMDDYEEQLRLLGDSLKGAREGIAGQVHVEQKGPSGEDTVVTIDHRLRLNLEFHEGWRIRTGAPFLPSAHFSSQARSYINASGRAGRGRAIYCHEPFQGEVVAALNYHIDRNPRFPLLITTLGLRIDVDDNAYLKYRTLAGVLVLKHHLHALATALNLGGHVDIDLSEKAQVALLARLGFRHAPRIRDFRPGGTHLRQAV